MVQGLGCISPARLAERRSIKAVFLTLTLHGEKSYCIHMLRRLIIAFFVFASLTSQASVAFACGMMGSATTVVKHCCCEQDMAGPGCDHSASGKGCCTTIVEVSVGLSDQVGDIAAPVQLPDYDPQLLSPVLLPTLLTLQWLPQPKELAWDEVSDHGLYGTDLYLRTQRLRI